ncbi:MAG: hypothetical protein NUV57_00790 [archaeon]|nr:hypothetical protein [archaeon]
MVKNVVKNKVILEVIDSCNKHIKKYGFRSTTVKDLRKKIEV